MAPGLTNAQIVLAVVQAAIDADVPYIHLLTQTHRLKAELVLRILLTFLPESTEPAAYIPLLRDLNGDGNGLPDSLVEAAEEKHAKQQSSPAEAKRKVGALRLLQLDTEDQFATDDPNDTISPGLFSFLLLRARRIDQETGTLPIVQQLLEPFVEQSAFLMLWLGSTILPLLRLNYEIFPHREQPIPLDEFERLRGGAALDTLVGGGIGGSTTASDYIRDLQQVVSPWLCGEIHRRKQQKSRRASGPVVQDVPTLCWGWVNNWLMHVASKQPEIALAIAQSSDWQGPGDVDDGGWFTGSDLITAWIWGCPQLTQSPSFQATRRAYLKTCLCLLYAIPKTSPAFLDGFGEMLIKVAEAENHAELVNTILNGSSRATDIPTLPAEYLSTVQNRAHRLQPVELLADGHPLTSLSRDSLALAAQLVRSSRTLLELQQAIPIARVLHISFLGTAQEQRALLQRVVQNVEDKKNSDEKCSGMRAELVDVAKHPKSSDGNQAFGVFGKVLLENASELDVLFFKTEVNSARYRHAIAVYADGNDELLTREQVEENAVQVALAAYDNSSNGNRTRGGVKKASDIVAAFKPSFPASEPLKEIEALIRATHALSFYKVTLQHGVPCVPVNIRVHPQPLSLLDKVLTQNPESYAQLDNLISIAADFVRAGLIKTPPPESSSQNRQTNLAKDALAALVTREVTAKAINAALEEGDFDTAYSYITTRLSNQASVDGNDDVLWRAAYAAGRAPPPNGFGSRHLRRLEQKMELLSQALALAPPSALADVLSTWQGCEIQVLEAYAAENDAEQSWNDQGEKRVVHDRHLPGGFGAESFIPNAKGAGGRSLRMGRGVQEEAPMGLFDMARAAGSALQKSAFPLQGNKRGQAADPESADDEDHTGEQRVRKRDVVSNAVTSGLVSGIGWVIGANPAREPQ